MVQLLVLSCSVDSLETEDIAAASSAYFATPLSLSRVGLPARREKSLVLAQSCDIRLKQKLQDRRLSR